MNARCKIPYLEFLCEMANTIPHNNMCKTIADEIAKYIVGNLPKLLSGQTFHDGEHPQKVLADKVKCIHNNGEIEVSYDSPLTVNPKKHCIVQPKLDDKIFSNKDWVTSVKSSITQIASTAPLYICSSDHFNSIECTGIKPPNNSRKRFFSISNFYNQHSERYPLCFEKIMKDYSLLYMCNDTVTHLTKGRINKISAELIKPGNQKDFFIMKEKRFLLLKVTTARQFKKPEKAHEIFLNSKRNSFVNVFEGGYKILLP